ncbi:hypothetical protein ABNavy1_210 [Acinetobacter phage AB-Navy1]|nr:hypothetical protein ABNavy1_210 [Acinetobacter phage AB-Navy1]UYL85975.1 hypothetical protein vBAbaPDP45_197 [Acinetobacter phage vB_AbaM_DP45]
MNFNRNESKRPVVLIDVDGVCVKWQSGLPYFMAKHAIPTEKALECILTEEFMTPSQLFGCDPSIAKTFVEEYNKSNFIKYLAPYDDALEMINMMKEHWDFVAVTALGTDKETVMNRLFNLNALFPGAFKDIFVCDFGESKDKVLERVRQKHQNIVMFIDDLGSNIESAARVLPDIPRYYIQRGPRPVVNVPHFVAKDLNEVRLHYLAHILPNSVLISDEV